MKTLSPCRTAMLAAAAFLLLDSEPAQAQIPCGSTITQSVTLQADMVCGNGQDGLRIGAHGVTIDLNGYSIRGPWDAINRPHAAHAYGIVSSGLDKVRVVGPGAIKGFYTPIMVLGARELYIGKIDAMNEWAAPIQLTGLTFSVIEDNRFHSLYLQGSVFNPNYANRIQRNRIGTPPGGGGGMLLLSGCESYENTLYLNEIIAEPGQGTPALAVAAGAYGNGIVANAVEGTVELAGAHNSYTKNKIVAPPGAANAVAVLGGQSLAVICRHGLDEGSGNTLAGNSIEGGLAGLRLQSLPNVIPIKGNRIVDNTFIGQVSMGIFFTIHAEDNDGRGNSYVNVPYPVVDHGVGNRWP